MDRILDKWVEDPIAHLNLLNQLIQKLIELFDTDSEKRSVLKKVIQAVETVREVLDDKGIIGSA